MDLPKLTISFYYNMQFNKFSFIFVNVIMKHVNQNNDMKIYIVINHLLQVISTINIMTGCPEL